MIEWLCARCGAVHNAQSKTFMPSGWHFAGSKLLCPDCTSVDVIQPVQAETVTAQSAEPIPTAFTPANETVKAGVEGFFAVYQPKETAVMLFFSRGNVSLSLAESAALEKCLAGANEIARGAHACQAGGST